MTLRTPVTIAFTGGALVATAALAFGMASRAHPVELVVRSGDTDEVARVADWPDTVTVDLRRTDTVVIRNDDDEPFYFGGATIAPGQSLVQRFVEPGVYVLQCGAHAAGTLRFVVLGDDGTIAGRRPDASDLRAQP
jgi:hypothetical protein